MNIASEPEMIDGQPATGRARWRTFGAGYYPRQRSAARQGAYEAATARVQVELPPTPPPKAVAPQPAPTPSAPPPAEKASNMTRTKAAITGQTANILAFAKSFRVADPNKPARLGSAATGEESAIIERGRREQEVVAGGYTKGSTIARKIGLNLAEFYRLVGQGQFPAAAFESGGTSFWHDADAKLIIKRAK
jgi:hypothetical protein